MQMYCRQVVDSLILLLRPIPSNQFTRWCTDQVFGISLGLVSCAAAVFTPGPSMNCPTPNKSHCHVVSRSFAPKRGDTIRIQHSEREASMASEGSWQSPKKCAFCGAHPIYQDPQLNFVWHTCHAVRLGHIEHIIQWFCMYYILYILWGICICKQLW